MSIPVLGLEGRPRGLWEQPWVLHQSRRALPLVPSIGHSRELGPALCLTEEHDPDGHHSFAHTCDSGQLSPPLLQVLICGDQLEAKRTISEMARAMGFTPLDMGSLASAREVEAIPLRLLPSWKVPTLLALGLFVCFYAYNFIRDVLQPYIRKDENKFYKMPLSVVNTTLPCVAYVMLSLVYLPGVLAAALQLRRGTKYQRFPDWLDHWLQHRKQIGLLSFFFAMLHALYSFCLPLRRSHRYDLVNLAVKQVQPSAFPGSWLGTSVSVLTHT